MNTSKHIYEASNCLENDKQFIDKPYPSWLGVLLHYELGCYEQSHTVFVILSYVQSQLKATYKTSKLLRYDRVWLAKGAPTTQAVRRIIVVVY